MVNPITILDLLIMLVPLALVAIVYWRWVGKPAEIGMATARMALQLLAMGYFLTFLFGLTSAWVGVAVIIVMLSISAWIALRSSEDRSWATYRRIFIAIGLAGTLNLLLVVFFVMGLKPWFELRAMVPIAGMIYSTGMNSVSLCAERFHAEYSRNCDYIDSRRHAYRASLIPQINSFLAVGLVSLPGMMTGQILAGVSPLEAVRYQIMVMCMVMGTAGLGAAIYLWLCRNNCSSG